MIAISPAPAGLFVAVTFAATVLAATRARTLRRRAAVIGRVSGVVPSDTRHARPATAILREPPARLMSELRALELPFDPVRAWPWWWRSCLVAVAVGAYLAGPVLGLIAGAMVAVGPFVALAVFRSRADAAYDAELAGALDAVGRGVRSGGSLPQAVAEASTSVRGRVAADLQHVAAAVKRGRPFADALRDWRGARGRPSVRLTVGALVLATQAGGPPARVIEEVAATIRTRQQVEREAHALAAQARLSAIVIGLAPLGFMAVTCLADPRNAHILFGTPIGVACLVSGLALDALGAVWMHRMSSGITP